MHFSVIIIIIRSALSVWIQVVLRCRFCESEQEGERESNERKRGERKDIKILEQKVTLIVYIYIVTIATV